MKPTTIKQNYLNIRLVGILRTKPKTPTGNAVNAIQTAFDAGAKAVEITSNSDYWQDIVDECVKRDLNIGVGSVKNKKTAKEAISHGAKFLVSPGLFPEVIEVSGNYKIPVLPGIYDIGEAWNAKDLGVLDVKFFPANVRTHEELYKAIKEPFRDEFYELEKKGWQIIPYNSSKDGIEQIIVNTPTQFYKQYLFARNNEPNCPIIIRLPAGKVGFERLLEISSNLSEVHTYAVGGVNDKNMKEVLTKYGAYGVCPGSGMFNSEAIVNGNFERIKNDTNKHIKAVEEIFP